MSSLVTMWADLSDRLSATGAEPDLNSVQADGRAGQTGHTNTFLQQKQSDWDNLRCCHLFLARCIIKPYPPNSLLITMTHFPSIPQAALVEIIHHEVLKRSSNCSLSYFSFCLPSSLHVSISFPTINLFPLYHLMHTSQPSGGCRKEGVRRKRFDVLSFSQNAF